MAPEVLVALLVGAGALLAPRRRDARLDRLLPAARPQTLGRRWWRRVADLAASARGRALHLRGRPPGTDVAAVIAELASLVRGGIPPPAAWAATATGLTDDHAGGVLSAAAAAGARGEPVADVLRAGASSVPPIGTTARSGDDGGLATLAATVAVHERTGAPVAELLDRAAAGLRADSDAALARRSALAAPLATARVLVALPPLGLLLGLAVGGDPVRVLVTEPVGRGCAVVGTVCAVTAWWWSRALVRRAVRS